jgi:hypothetical protein
MHVFQRSRITLTGEATKGLIDILEMGIDGSDDTADALLYLVATRPPMITQRKLRGL